MQAPLFLFLVPYLNQFFAVEHLSAVKYIILGANLVLSLKKLVPELHILNGAIWNEFSGQHQHQSTIFNSQFALLWC